jgi:hypothetical protein
VLVERRRKGKRNDIDTRSKNVYKPRDRRTVHRKCTDILQVGAEAEAEAEAEVEVEAEERLREEKRINSHPFPMWMYNVRDIHANRNSRTEILQAGVEVEAEAALVEYKTWTRKKIYLY